MIQVRVCFTGRSTSLLASTQACKIKTYIEIKLDDAGFETCFGWDRWDRWDRWDPAPKVLRAQHKVLRAKYMF